mmetsp:Transcript_6463/g.17315  ORF Transcript_6463/g.17315 Transcript_6463/m.17315 type:complete len:235 (+) Transcript_6463:36-740(+)
MFASGGVGEGDGGGAVLAFAPAGVLAGARKATMGGARRMRGAQVCMAATGGDRDGEAARTVRVVADRGSAAARAHVADARARKSYVVAASAPADDAPKLSPRIAIDFEAMGIVPYIFVAICFGAAIKVVKGFVKKEPVKLPDSVITSPEQEKELHVYKCESCGYELYVARGREFKFFGDDFKCPVCKVDKSRFWDLNDPTDPRNAEDDDDEEGGLAEDLSDKPPSPGSGVKNST